LIADVGEMFNPIPQKPVYVEDSPLWQQTATGAERLNQLFAETGMLPAGATNYWQQL
jgi:hypothetical protein